MIHRAFDSRSAIALSLFSRRDSFGDVVALGDQESEALVGFLTEYPLAVYGKGLAMFLTFGVPLAFVNWRPALYVLNKPDPLGLPTWTGFLSPIVALLLALVTGVAWRSAGLALDVAEALGAWAMASSIAAAAVRLGVVGHLGAQAELAHARTVAAEILLETPDPTAPLYAFTPLVDVALMRHDHRDLRLFAT